jgi:hypothetical protein
MGGIIDVLMSPEFSLDVLVSQESHLSREVLAVCAEKAAVEVHGRQECDLVRPETAASGCDGHSKSRRLHFGQVKWNK